MDVLVNFGSVVGKMSGVALLLSKRVLDGVVEYREVSAKLLWEKVKFGEEILVFASAYGLGSRRSDEER